jgi:hypothetical protein
MGELIETVAEPATFNRSAGGVGNWIEPEYDPLTGEIAQLHCVAVMCEQAEMGRFVTKSKHEVLRDKA